MTASALCTQFWTCLIWCCIECHCSLIIRLIYYIASITCIQIQNGAYIDMVLKRVKLTEADRRHIIARSGGCCNKCRTPLFLENEFGERARLGDDAHIVAASEDGPRGESDLDAQSRASSKNVLLLCKNCHAKVDQQPKRFPVASLLQMREEHYNWIGSCLGDIVENRPPFHYLSYINVPRADMYAAANSISLPQPQLGAAESIRDLGIASGQLMAGYVRVLNHDDLYANEFSNDTALTDLRVGEYWYSPEATFRSKKVLHAYSKAVPLAWKKQECIIYRKFDGWRLICMIDPRWMTTSTASITLSSGMFKTIALVHIASIDTASKVALASPIFLGAPDKGFW